MARKQSRKPASSSPTVDYRQMFNTMPSPYILFAADSPAYTILDQNQAHADMSMVHRGQVIGKPTLEAYPDTSRKYTETGVSDLIASFDRVVSTGQPDTMSAFRYDLKDKTGEFVERYFQVTHYPVFGEQDNVTAILQATADVTEAVLSDIKLRQTEQQLAEALAIARVGTWIWEIQRNRVVADGNLAHMFGVSAEEAAAGMTLETFTNAIHPDDRERVAKEIASAIANKRFYDAEYRTIDAKGNVHWLLARGRIETDDNGEAVRFPGVILDITDRRKLEDELRIANRDLEQRVHERTQELEDINAELNRSNQELQDFAYVASHDLQEPLRKIQAFGNLLEQEYTEQLGDGADYLARMRAAAARMSSLITDLLSFSRVTTKVQPFVMVDLSVIVRDVINDLEARIGETKGSVTVGVLPSIEADPVQMRQLFQNLIGNALKFHKPDVSPQVTVAEHSRESDGAKMVEIRVMDNGVGFDTKYADKIFAVFQRLHTRDAYEGTGIGLAVCRKIVERHSGEITAISQPGEGAEFIIALPRQAAVVDQRKNSNKHKDSL